MFLFESEEERKRLVEAYKKRQEAEFKRKMDSMVPTDLAIIGATNSFLNAHAPYIRVSPYASPEQCKAVIASVKMCEDEDSRLHEWRKKMGAAAYHPDDGWVYRASSSKEWYAYDGTLIGRIDEKGTCRSFDEHPDVDDVRLIYPEYYADDLKVGDRICLGGWGYERIVKVSEIIKSDDKLYRSSLCKFVPDPEFSRAFNKWGYFTKYDILNNKNPKPKFISPK